jgi:hypothetical protein
MRMSLEWDEEALIMRQKAYVEQEVKMGSDVLPIAACICNV